MPIGASTSNGHTAAAETTEACSALAMAIPATCSVRCASNPPSDRRTSRAVHRAPSYSNGSISADAPSSDTVSACLSAARRNRATIFPRPARVSASNRSSSSVPTARNPPSSFNVTTDDDASFPVCGPIDAAILGVARPDDAWRANHQPPTPPSNSAANGRTTIIGSIAAPHARGAALQGCPLRPFSP